MVFFLPETARNIVGNGSIRPPKLPRLPLALPAFNHWKQDNVNAVVGPVLRSRPDWRALNPFRTLTILFRPDNLVVITAGALLYVVYTCVNASLSVLFVDIYSLKQWQAGLIYLPFGAGGITSSFISGPLINSAYRKARRKRGLSTERAAGADLDNFPVEKARLPVIWAPLVLTAASVLAFGWVVQYRKVR